MRRLLCLCLLSPVGLLAQASGPPPAAPRAFGFADTLGAAFSIADSAKGLGGTADFDYLEGLWQFRFQQRRPDGTFNPPFAGHWSAAKKRTANGFIEDHFRGDNLGETWDWGTWTYRVFNPQRKVWEMQGINTNTAVWAPGLCWADGAERHCVQRYGIGIMRIRYFNITDKSFQWRADRSTDDGRTWTLDWWTMEAVRLAK